MESNKFFRAVWRFNALLLAFGGFLVVAMVSWNLLFSPLFATLPQGHFAPVSKGAEKDHTYRLTRLQFTLNQEAIFQLGRWDGAPNVYGLQDASGRGSYEHDGPDTVNLLAVDSANGAAHWLFHGINREIVSEDTITRPGDRADPVAVAAPGHIAIAGDSVIALVVHIVDADTNKDGVLTDKDRQSLYTYRPGTGVATKLIDVDYLLSSDQVNGMRYLVVHERGKTAIASIYSLPDFKLISEKPLPSVPD